MIGTTLGPYQILEKVGQGGMGEVYRARDTRLDRIVAIKTLPQIGSDQQARERFEREARTISRLDHPHICALHDIGRHGDIDYLVLEFLQGETLAQRLIKGALPLEQALRIASEIAGALEAAHRQHIVHRDLKPGNVMLTKAGAKLLDFGLAKARPLIGAATPDASVLPTAAAPITAEGTILGTLQYMAPEQLEGREADVRTDVFAFGAVLYEMVTGRRAFEGRSQAGLIAAILEHEPPPITGLQPLAPSLLDRIVRRCLEKDPDDRWQSVADLSTALDWVTEQEEAAAAPAVTSSKRWSRIGVVLAVFAALTASIVAVARWRTPALESSTGHSAMIQFAIADTPPWSENPGMMPALAIARNGSAVVYLAMVDGVRDLYVRQLGEAASRRLRGTENALMPFVSPDGKWVAFTQGARLKKVSLDGGVPVTICEMGATRGATWGGDNTIIFSSTTDSGLWRVSADGGVPSALTTPDGSRGERSHRWPYMLPGDKAVLYTIAKSDILSFDDGLIAMRDLVTGESRELVRGGSFPMYSTARRLVYSRAGTILAAPFNLETLQIEGPSTTVLNNVVTYPATGAAQIGISDTGVLVSMSGGPTLVPSAVSFVDRTGNVKDIPFPPALYISVAVAPDGQTIALGTDHANASIWIGNLETATATRLTLAWSNNDPYWAPDGSRVAFTSGRGGARNVFSQSIDGSEPEQLTKSEHNQAVTSWSPDGRFIAYTDQTATAPRDIFVMDLENGRRERLLIQTPFDEYQARFSPDGKWIAYVSDESGRAEVYVQSFPEPKRKTRVSRDGGAWPIWAKDGRELYYRSGSALMAVEIASGPTLAFGMPRVLFRNASLRAQFDVTRDGRFVMIRNPEPSAAASPITVTVNWLDALRQR